MQAMIESAQRDRRWCQGNMQHARVMLARGLHPVNRAHLAMGVMSYLSSPLWLIFLVLTGLAAYIQLSKEPVYFFGEHTQVVWPVSYAVEMETVLFATLAFLFLPKIFALLLLATNRQQRLGHGGLLRAGASALAGKQTLA